MIQKYKASDQRTVQGKNISLPVQAGHGGLDEASEGPHREGCSSACFPTMWK